MFGWRAVVIGACALWACGGSSNPAAPPPTTPTPVPTTMAAAPTTLADLSAAVTSPQAEGALNCSDDIRARVTLTNRGATAVTVTGLLNRSGVVAGRCSGAGEFTFQFSRQALPNSTTLIFDQSLYPDGPGCCRGSGCAGACRIQEGFEVITSVGSVPAGVFNYQIFFQNCPSCPSLSAAQACPPGSARFAPTGP